MICKHCNSVIPDNSAFCTNCGQKAEAAQPAPVSQSQPTFCTSCGAHVPAGSAFCTNCGATVAAAAPAPKKGLPKGAIIGIIAGGVGAVLIALIILLISLLSGNSEEDVIDLYFQASCYADVDAAMDCYPEDFLEALMDEENVDVDDLEDELKDALDRAEDEYGDFEDYEYEIVDEDEVDQDDLEEFVELIERYYDINLDIESAKEVEIDYIIYFEDDEIEDSITLILIEVDGSWYLFRGGSLF